MLLHTDSALATLKAWTAEGPHIWPVKGHATRRMSSRLDR